MPHAGITLDAVKVVGCDGTNVNTGRNGGVIRLLEQHIGTPVQWAVCMLHINELPLRHLFSEIDGSTAGPNAFKGPLGRRLTAAPTLASCDIVDYNPIESPNLPLLIDSDMCELSTDQKYMYLITQAIKTGICSSRIASLEPGNISHSRWLTTANSICRLYVSTPAPSSELTDFVTFIMRVYAPVWFRIKRLNRLQDAPMNLYCLVSWSRYLCNRLLSVVDNVIKRNAFAAHAENILYAMIHDKRAHVQELGLRRIMKARSSENTPLRQFIVPPVNFGATDYFDLICWFDASTVITSPPILRDVTTDHIAQQLASLPYFRCHTQSVERMLRVITEASAQVVGQNARDGVIRYRLEARSQRPKFNTKRDYVL